MRRTWVVAVNLAILVLCPSQAVALLKARHAGAGACEPHGTGAGLCKVVAEVLARENLFVRARHDNFIDQRISTAEPGGMVGETGHDGLVKLLTVRERLKEVSRLEPSSGR